MDVALVVVAYGLPFGTAPFESARRSLQPLTTYVFRHSTTPSVVAACERVATSPDVVYLPYGVNRGLANSWNEGMVRAFEWADVVLFANDDVEFADGDVDRLVATAAAHPEHYVVTCAGVELSRRERAPSLGYACFAMNRVAFDELGCLDQNLFPIYCEDEDHSRRAALAGLREANCPDTAVRHFGSAAIRGHPELDRQNRVTHAANFAYYQRKWGGPAGHERFRNPFDDPSLGPRIDPDRRHTPYGPGRDRTDHHIVAI
ncbi:glycosyltransferase family 2 protein [Umezawaea tangerina]|uniref:GT2 family glycosyltransferase n=1 Tax=Umezawaea tangerina TaxID=84725 RepID=A0A2T0T257_9PSEU|nr:glycosyltransferase [Umezawaea tangerina]PRY39742.1 GT2 family glycosyltransferase [Umezawaea tangerina]